MERPRKPSPIVKVPRLRTNVVRPRGPRALTIKEQYIGGYGDPPVGFIGGQNSITEWIYYWASAKIFDDPKEPRRPPFFGGIMWAYQVPKGGKFVRALGSAVVDFIYYLGNTVIAIRIQTEYFHTFTNSRKQASDLMQKVNLTRGGLIVVDVYDTALLGDPSGQKAIVAAKRALAMIEDINPITAGTGVRGSRLRVIQ